MSSNIMLDCDICKQKTTHEIKWIYFKIGSFCFYYLRPGLLLLLLVQSEQGHVGHLDNLEADTRNISDGVTRTTESSHQHLILYFMHKYLY